MLQCRFKERDQPPFLSETSLTARPHTPSHAQAAYFVGVAATSPFFVSVGCIGIIPLSTIADLVLKPGTLPSLADAGGCVLIVAGFLVLNAFQGEVGEEE